MDVFVASGSGLSGPLVAVFGPDGNLYVGDISYNIKKFNGVTGAPMGVFSAGASFETNDTNLALLFGPDGNLYAADYANVYKINGTTGAFMGIFVAGGSGGMLNPRNMAYGPDGELYVVGENGVYRFNTTTGAFIGLSAPVTGGVAFGPDGDLYVQESNYYVQQLNQIFRYNGETGNLINIVISSAQDVGYMTGFVFTPNAAPPCSLSPSGASFGWAGGLGSLTVKAGPSCTWSAVPSADWISLRTFVAKPIVAFPAGSASTTTVLYTVAANMGTARRGSISVGNQTFSVTQAGYGGCSYSIGPSFAAPTDAGGTVTVSVSASAGCSWWAVSNVPWMTVKSGASDSGGGVVVLNVAANSGTARSGTATIAGEMFTVTQGAGACGAIDETSLLSFSQGGFYHIGLPASNLYDEKISITNTTGSAINGPLYYVFIGLPNAQGAGLTDADGVTYCFSPSGSSMLSVAAGGLAPGQSVTEIPTFLNPPFSGSLDYTPKILSGTPSK
jgi:hypothetical protein